MLPCFLPALLLASFAQPRHPQAQAPLPASSPLSPSAPAPVQTTPTRSASASALPSSSPDASFDYAQDARLSQKISLQCKSISFAELFRRMQAMTGVAFRADPLVADDNITLFCRNRSLSDIMEQIARHFDFIWRRVPDKVSYLYELTQTPLQIARERAARSLDKASGLAVLDREMERYRPLLTMTKEQIEEARAHGTSLKGVDVRYFRQNCGPALYLSLSSEEKSALLRGEPLTFTATAANTGRIPTECFQRQVDYHASLMSEHHVTVNGVEQPEPPHPTQEQMRAATDTVMRVTMQVHRDKADRCRFEISGVLSIPSLGYARPVEQGYFPVTTLARLAVDNRKANAGLAADAEMRRAVTLDIKPTAAQPISAPSSDFFLETPAATSADYEEAVFNAVGSDVIGDSFPGFWPVKNLETGRTLEGRPQNSAPGKDKPLSLFDALCSNSDTMHLYWKRAGGWLTFRAPDYFNRRPLQTPSRTLERWAASRREHGAATLDDIAEMSFASRGRPAQIVQAVDSPPIYETDTPEQTPEERMEGQERMRMAYARYGLLEWELAHDRSLQAHCRFLGKLPPELRRLAAGKSGLPFSRLPFDLRAEFTRLAYGGFVNRLQPGLGDLMENALRVEYKPMSRSQPSLPPSDGSDAPQGIGHLLNDDGTLTEIAVTPQPPLLHPDWSLKFIYTFGSKRTGKFRRTVTPGGFSVSEPGQLKD